MQPSSSNTRLISEMINDSCACASSLPVATLMARPLADTLMGTFNRSLSGVGFHETTVEGDEWAAQGCCENELIKYPKEVSIASSGKVFGKVMSNCSFSCAGIDNSVMSLVASASKALEGLLLKGYGVNLLGVANNPNTVITSANSSTFMDAMLQAVLLASSYSSTVNIVWGQAALNALAGSTNINKPNYTQILSSLRENCDSVCGGSSISFRKDLAGAVVYPAGLVAHLQEFVQDLNGNWVCTEQVSQESTWMATFKSQGLLSQISGEFLFGGVSNTSGSTFIQL